ncbi:hypothetical protein Cgig2_030135 [Carnegiea gigantea]|uniref:Uncharacterized protein n=1 Tax=Carnegiea gigantea TaxID=171969 RepID=A0A9Q1K0R0_9CARY|nr:hypothetical protein Cgig2_030135 [Carnegiea gigantea]
MEYDPTKLRTRMSPYGLCNFLPSISNEQKRDITKLEFAFLLTLRVDKIPSRLARWLVENFDTCSNDELRISEKYVYITMGFPRGSKPIQEAKKGDNGEYAQVLDEWKAQWPVDLKEVKDLNWCEFMIDSLISCTDKWKRVSQSVQVESPNQGGNGGIRGFRSGGQSSPDFHIQRSPNLGSKSLAGDAVGDCLPLRKKMPAPHFRSLFFIRHIDALKSLTIQEKQVPDWAFLSLDEVHYDSFPKGCHCVTVWRERESVTGRNEGFRV